MDIKNGVMHSNEFGEIAEFTWHDLANHNHHISLDQIIIMPNHLHGIITIKGDDFIRCFVRTGSEPAPTNSHTRHGLSEIVRQFKTFSAKRINNKRKISGVSVWQRNYYERIIDAHVVLNKENKNQVVAIKLRVSGQTLNTENKSTNLRVAIDTSVDKLEKQLVKYKEKWQRKGTKPQQERLEVFEPPVEIEEPELIEGEGAVLTFEEEDQAEESPKTGS